MSRKPQTDKPNLLAVLAAAGEEDLAQVTGRIDELEKELAGLKEARKLLDFRLHGKPARSPKEPGEGDGSSLAERIYEVLATVGQATPKQLAAQLHASPQGVGWALRCDWFRKLDSGEWTIAKTQDRQR